MDENTIYEIMYSCQYMVSETKEGERLYRVSDTDLHNMAHAVAAARDEQLAEMREALSLHEQLRDLAYESGYYAGRMEQAASSTTTDFSAVLGRVIAQRNVLSNKMKRALSFAPAVGRVLWKKSGTIYADEGFHEDERQSYIYTAYEVHTEDDAHLNVLVLGTDYKDQALDVHGGQNVEIIIREKIDGTEA